MKIVIFGLAKSGTTALFYKIKHSMPADTICLFEPGSFDVRDGKKRGIKSILPTRREPDVLAKVLPFRPHAPADVDSFSGFDKQILIVRDPRDRLISRLLYGVYESGFCQYDDKVMAFIEVLKEKETDPTSVPLKTLLKTFAGLNGESFSFEEWSANHQRHSVKKPLDFHAGHGRVFLFKYEDMIDNHLGSLEEYLGLPLDGRASVASELRRVSRTKSYGGWREWFTAEDVEYFGPVLQPFLDRYYPKANWELSLSPSIPAAQGSEYVERIVNDRRAALQLPPFVFAAQLK